MEFYEQIVSIIALTMGASWASGINLYATLAVLLMYAVEFVVDKIPGLDSTWDALHTFVRIPAGAMLAAGAVGEMGPVL